MMGKNSPLSITFICGSLQQGKDGVGDYTRKLAAACKKLGNTVSIIALNDGYIKSLMHETQIDNDISITCLRLPKQLPEKDKIIEARKFVSEQDPDWISLQFVPFSFHPKGLHLHLGMVLNAIGGQRNWHIMFHEVWVGLRNDVPFKTKLWGQLQKILIRQLIKQIKPKVTTAACSLYSQKLSPFVKNHHKLELFSNIPVIQNEGNLNSKVKNESITFIIFGGIHPTENIENFVQSVHTTFAKTARLQLIGRNGIHANAWKDAWTKYDMPVETAGELTDIELSKYLSAADFGITTTPMFLVEKSGSIAAMLAHELPVISVANQWKAQDKKTNNAQISGVYPFSTQKDFNFSDLKATPSSNFNPTYTARAMIRLFQMI